MVYQAFPQYSQDVICNTKLESHVLLMKRKLSYVPKEELDDRTPFPSTPLWGIWTLYKSEKIIFFILTC